MKEFERAFEQRCDAARARFESQDEKHHAELDMELTTKIDDLYRAVLGPWEGPEADWWHNMDFYGDGVRALRFVLKRFPPDSIAKIAPLLTGKHDGFSMLVWFWEKQIEEGKPVGGLWLSARELIVTRSLVEPLGLAA
ncbi:MAG TPA: hypothetical protein VMF52_20580 [Steroidobacteraceae bacterium]|nr:hypothetical protein [Steroidobacteraceae bacterium]